MRKPKTGYRYVAIDCTVWRKHSYYLWTVIRYFHDHSPIALYIGDILETGERVLLGFLKTLSSVQNPSLDIAVIASTDEDFFII